MAAPGAQDNKPDAAEQPEGSRDFRGVVKATGSSQSEAHLRQPVELQQISGVLKRKQRFAMYPTFGEALGVR